MTAPSGNAASRPAYHHGDLHRALIDAARALMAERQNWDFSLRELARRAGVSHNAPYNHFSDKRDLLSALAVDGFERLTARMADAVARAPTPEDAGLAIGRAYVHFGLDHPEDYRLMFGLSIRTESGALPERVKTAAVGAKSVLRGLIEANARAGAGVVDPDDRAAIEIEILTDWAFVHGLTMLFLDRLYDRTENGADAAVSIDALVEAALRRHMVETLSRQPAKPSGT